MKEKIAKLIDVKSMTTITLVAVFCYLNVTGKEISQEFNSILLMVFTFYFSHQAQSKNQTTSHNEIITDEREVINNGD